MFQDQETEDIVWILLFHRLLLNYGFVQKHFRGILWDFSLVSLCVLIISVHRGGLVNSGMHSSPDTV